MSPGLVHRRACVQKPSLLALMLIHGHQHIGIGMQCMQGRLCSWQPMPGETADSMTHKLYLVAQGICQTSHSILCRAVRRKARKACTEKAVYWHSHSKGI